MKILWEYNRDFYQRQQQKVNNNEFILLISLDRLYVYISRFSKNILKKKNIKVKKNVQHHLKSTNFIN